MEYVTNQDVVKMTGLAYNTLYSYRGRGILPPPDKHIGRTPLWKHKTIEKWVAQRELEVVE